MATSSPAIAAVSEDIYISRDIIRIALANSLRDGERKRAFVYCIQGFALSVGTYFYAPSYINF